MNNREIEIDLRSMLIYIFEHWRSVVAAMVIVCFLGGFFGIYRVSGSSSSDDNSNLKAISAEIDSKQEILDKIAAAIENGEEPDIEFVQEDEDETEAPVVLSDTQKMDVQKAVFNMGNYYKLMKFIDSSVYMKLDPDVLATGSLTLAFTSASNENLGTIKNLYKAYLRTSDFKSYVQNKTGLDFSEDTLMIFSDEESPYAYVSPDTFFSFSILYLTEKDCTAILNAAVEYLQGKKYQLARLYGDHDINVMDSSVSTIRDYNIKTEQINNLKTAQDYYYAGQNSKVTFIKEQLEYYKELLEECNWNTAEEQKSVDFMILKKTYEKQVNQLEEEIAALDEQRKGVSSSGSGVSSSVLAKQAIKYGLIGIFLGAFLMACFWAVNFIFRNRLDLFDDIGNYYGLYELGRIPQKKREKEFIFDTWIRKWKNHAIKNSPENALKLCATQIGMLAEKENVSNVLLVSCADEFTSSSDLKVLCAEVNDRKISTAALENVLSDTGNMSRLADASGVVLVGKSNVTRRNDLFQSIDLLKMQDVKVLGGVVIG